MRPDALELAVDRSWSIPHALTKSRFVNAPLWWQRKPWWAKAFWIAETFVLDVCGSINTLARDFHDYFEDDR